MNGNGHFEDDDLALYAMNLLAEPEASEIARYVAGSHEAREHLAEMQARLAAFAVATVPMLPVPPGSRGRLMVRIAREKEMTSPQQPVTKTGKQDAAAAKERGALSLWIGWAVAAMLTATVGMLYQSRAAIQSVLTTQTGRLGKMSIETTGVGRERDALRVTVAEQAKRIEELTAASAIGKRENDRLASTKATEIGKLNEQTAQNESTQREIDVLRRTVAAQTSQIAELSTNAGEERKVLETLTDKTALRVTLTKPKSSAVPTGHATYVAGRGSLVFQGSNLLPLKSNKVYQLWLMPADGSNPIPAGTFTPDAQGDASIVNVRFSNAVTAKGFAVTIEDQGGSQTPTLPIVLAGTGGV